MLINFQTKYRISTNEYCLHGESTELNIWTTDDGFPYINNYERKRNSYFLEKTVIFVYSVEQS